jgi:hypothetical protein
MIESKVPKKGNSLLTPPAFVCAEPAIVAVIYLERLTTSIILARPLNPLLSFFIAY